MGKSILQPELTKKTRKCYLTGRTEWRNIRGYEGFYQVSNEGNVRSVDRVINQQNGYGGLVSRLMRGKQLSLADNGYGYLIAGLRKGNQRKNHYIHRLVAEHFIGNIPDGYVVNHKDFNKHNNSVCNLEIITQKENIMFSIHSMKKPRSKPMGAIEKYICKRPSGKYEVCVKGTYIGRYKTIEEARRFRNAAMEQERDYFKELEGLDWHDEEKA